jgi:alpha-L-arabinofuranosidase
MSLGGGNGGFGWFEMNNGSAPSTRGTTRQVVFHHVRPFLEQGMHRGAEGTDPFAVDDPDTQNSSPPAFLEVIGDQLLDVARTEGVQVEHAVDRQFDGIRRRFVLLGHGYTDATRRGICPDALTRHPSFFLIWPPLEILLCYALMSVSAGSRITGLQYTACPAVTGAACAGPLPPLSPGVGRHSLLLCCLIVGSLLGLLGMAEGTPITEATEPEPVEERSHSTSDPVAPARVQAWLNLVQTGASIDPFIYGQALHSLVRGIRGGLLAELLHDRKFFDPPTHPHSPWHRVGSEVGWSLTFDVERPYTGRGSVKILVTDRAQEDVHGIAQRNLALLADRLYEGHVIMAGRGLVKVILSWGDQVGDRDVITIRLNQEHFGRYPLRFRPRATSDAGVLSIGLESTGAIWIGGASLMRADHVEGLRADTLDLLKGLGTPTYRWPGGSSVNGYDWREAIGPKERRPPRRHPSEPEVESNDFGIDEFLAFCRELKAEPLVVVDTSIGSPELAAALVQYCNGSPRTTWGRRRLLNGRPEPYRVRWWGVGGALPGHGQSVQMSADQRLARHREFVHAMRAMDDEIQLVAIGRAGSWSEQMLARAADTMSLLSEQIPLREGAALELNNHALPTVLRAIVEQRRTALEKEPPLQARSIPIALDGWQAGSDMSAGSESLPEGLLLAQGLQELTRHAELLRMAHYAADTGGAVGTVGTSSTNAWLRSAATPMTLYRHHFGSHSVRVEGGIAPLDAAAALNSDHSLLTFSIINPSHAPVILGLEVLGGSLTEHATRYRIDFSPPVGSELSHGEMGRPIETTVVDDFDPGGIEVPPFSVTLFVVPTRR